MTNRKRSAREKRRWWKLTLGELLLVIGIIAATTWLAAAALRRSEAQRQQRLSHAQDDWQRVLTDDFFKGQLASRDYEEWRSALAEFITAAVHTRASLQECEQRLGRAGVATSQKFSRPLPWLGPETPVWRFNLNFPVNQYVASTILVDVDEGGMIREAAWECVPYSGSRPGGITGFARIIRPMQHRPPAAIDRYIGVLIGVPLALLMLTLLRRIRRAARLA